MNDSSCLPFQVAFLTGQSNPPGAALSHVQAAFLAALPVPMEGKITRNFPYLGDMTDPPFAPVPLLTASLRNGWQYVTSRYPSFGARHRSAVETFLARADRTLLLAGSCGLELFNNLALPASALQRVTIFAYGPVARRRPRCACLFVQGKRDWISRRYFRTVDARVNAGHLDYLADPAVLALAVKAVQQLAASTRTAVMVR